MNAESPTVFSTLSGYAAAADAWIALAARDRSRRGRATEAVRQLGRFARVFPIGRARLFLARGDLAAQDGQTRGARRLWQRGLAAARALDLAHDERLLLQRLGSGETST